MNAQSYSLAKSCIETLRKVLTRIGWLLAFIALALVAGCLIPRPLFKTAEASGDRSVEILVITNPIHTDIAIPASVDTLAAFAFLADSGMPIDNPNVRWIMFGWGGRTFYTQTPTWSKVKLMPVLKALTADSATLHIEPLGEVDRGNPAVMSLTVSNAGFAALRREMLATFTRDASGVAELIPNSAYGENDRFYEASGVFNALLGCNTWAAQMLRVAGVRTGLWNPFPQSLRLSVKLQN